MRWVLPDQRAMMLMQGVLRRVIALTVLFLSVGVPIKASHQATEEGPRIDEQEFEALLRIPAF